MRRRQAIRRGSNRVTVEAVGRSQIFFIHRAARSNLHSALPGVMQRLRRALPSVPRPEDRGAGVRATRASGTSTRQSTSANEAPRGEDGGSTSNVGAGPHQAAQNDRAAPPRRDRKRAVEQDGVQMRTRGVRSAVAAIAVHSHCGMIAACKPAACGSPCIMMRRLRALTPRLARLTTSRSAWRSRCRRCCSTGCSIRVSSARSLARAAISCRSRAATAPSPRSAEAQGV